MPSYHRQVQAGFNRAAHRYDEYAQLQRLVARELWERAKRDTVTHTTWLDIGCGTGFLQELLRSSQHHNPFIQLDIAPSMCDIAAQFASDPEYGQTYTVNADMAALPISTSVMDGVISSLAMQWSGDMAVVFNEVARVLREGGKFHASIMGAGSLVEFAEAYQHFGREAPILNFITAQHLQQSVAPYFSKVMVQEKPITLYYDDVMQLMKGLRGIGASYRGQRQRLANKTFFHELALYYQQRYGAEQGIPATWNILYIEGEL